MIKYSKFKKEEQRLYLVQSNLELFSEQISNIERIFIELVDFVDKSPNAMILTKTGDITQFMHKSYKDLETITNSEIEERKRICIDPMMRPSYLNSVKIIDFIKNMNLIAQSADTLNAFELKFLKDPLPRFEESKDISVTPILPDTVTLG
jgi:hypothetical protein